MTDREALIEMFDRAGVKWETHESGGDTIYVLAADQNEGPNRGYWGFYASFGFAENGQLEDVGAWE